MKKFLLRVLALVELVAALLFLLVAVIFVTLLGTGMLNRERARETWSLLRGEKVAVLKRDHKRWQEMDEAARSKTMVEREEQKGSGLINAGLEKKRRVLQKQLNMERAILERINEQLRKREQSLKDARDQLTRKQATFAANKARSDAERQDQRLKKALKIYADMDAEQVAQNFQTRWNSTDVGEQDEIVKLLRNMRENRASEVIGAIQDADIRIDMMKAIKNS